MSKRYIKSNKYTGVYFETLEDGDKSYYITYKDTQTNKKVWIKIGKYSEGIREPFCNQKRLEIINKQRLGEEPPALVNKKKKNITTFEYIANLYFSDKELHNRSVKHSFLKYKKHLSYLDKKDIERITLNDIERLQKEKSANYSPKTVNEFTGLISTIYNHSIKKGILEHNPCKNLTRLKVDNKRERFLAREEVEKLYCEIKDIHMLYFFVKLSLNTGGRKSTIFNIRKKDIDFSSGKILLKDFKTDSTYRGFVKKEILDELREFTKELRANDIILGDGRVEFKIEKRLVPILNDLFNREIEPTDSKNRVVIHTLRHTFASHLAINETPIYTIQKLMNHKDINMTLRYAKLSPDSGDKSVEKLGF